MEVALSVHHPRESFIAIVMQIWESLISLLFWLTPFAMEPSYLHDGAIDHDLLILLAMRTTYLISRSISLLFCLRTNSNS